MSDTIKDKMLAEFPPIFKEGYPLTTERLATACASICDQENKEIREENLRLRELVAAAFDECDCDYDSEFFKLYREFHNLK